jgi:hypothetical protein
MSGNPPSPTNNSNSNNNNANNSNVLFQNIDVSDNIVNYTLNQTLSDANTTTINQQGTTAAGNMVTQTTFTTDVSGNININQNLEEVVISYYEDTSCNNSALINQIRAYANEIKCEDFHGKGSIDDYSALFQAASQIANDTKQMTLDIDTKGFEDFGKAADDLSALFTSFISKLQNVSIIDDTAFLTSIVNALAKIVNLSNIFGKFRETIIATSYVQIPKSAHDTKLILQTLSSELNCAMGYIAYFVDSSAPKPLNADLSANDLNVITKAVTAIENYNILCEQGVTIALTNSADVQYIKMVNSDLESKTTALRTATNKLRAKLASYNL